MEQKQIVCNYFDGGYPASHLLYRHCHNNYELLLFVEGDAEYVIENEVFALKPFTLVITKPAEYHYIKIVSKRRYIRFLLTFTAGLLDESFAKYFSALHSCYYLDANSDIVDSFYKIKRLSEAYDDREMHVIQINVLQELLIHLYHRGLDGTQTTAHKTTLNETVSRIIAYVDDNLCRPLTLAVIADALYMSASHVSHIFKRYMHTSLMKYICSKKILHAQTLIKSGLNPVKASETLGFTDYVTFYKTYKRVLGVIPSRDKAR